MVFLIFIFKFDDCMMWFVSVVMYFGLFVIRLFKIVGWFWYSFDSILIVFFCIVGFFIVRCVISGFMLNGVFVNIVYGGWVNGLFFLVVFVNDVRVLSVLDVEFFFEFVVVRRDINVSMVLYWCIFFISMLFICLDWSNWVIVLVVCFLFVKLFFCSICVRGNMIFFVGVFLVIFMFNKRFVIVVVVIFVMLMFDDFVRLIKGNIVFLFVFVIFWFWWMYLNRVVIVCVVCNVICLFFLFISLINGVIVFIMFGFLYIFGLKVKILVRIEVECFCVLFLLFVRSFIKIFRVLYVGVFFWNIFFWEVMESKYFIRCRMWIFEIGNLLVSNVVNWLIVFVFEFCISCVSVVVVIFCFLKLVCFSSFRSVGMVFVVFMYILIFLLWLYRLFSIFVEFFFVFFELYFRSCINGGMFLVVVMVYLFLFIFCVKIDSNVVVCFCCCFVGCFSREIRSCMFFWFCSVCYKFLCL